MMRTVSFVERLELEFPGNHSSHALSLGDVDGDGLNELVVGGLDGSLVVFKGQTSAKPWLKSSDLGTITSVAIGDITNQKKNFVICSTAEGVCHIFDYNNVEKAAPPPSLQQDGSKWTGAKIKPWHSQYISLNIKTLLIDSIDSNGCCDIFVGYTDRAVGAYRWSTEAHCLIALTDRLPLSGQVGSLSVGGVSSKSGCGQLLVSQAGGTCVPLIYTDSHTSQSGPGSENGTASESGPKTDWCLRLTYEKESMEGSIGGIQIRNPIVGTEVVATTSGKSESLTPPPPTTPLPTPPSPPPPPLSSPSSPPPPPHSSPSSSHLPPPSTKKEKERSSFITLCTLDGSLKLLKDGNKEWELQVDHNLFSLHRLDITGLGSDEVVCCAWDGVTYIVDRTRNVVKFHLGESVCAFCAGNYGNEGKNVPCLVYSTFRGLIFIYHNVSLPSIPSTNLLQSLSLEELQGNFKENWKDLTDLQKRSRIHSCLYLQEQSL